MFTIIPDKDVLQKIHDENLSPEALNKLYTLIGHYVSEKAQDNARNNSKGGRFWNAIANTVTYVVKPNGVVIGATHEAARHKHTGGIISAPGKGDNAQKAQALTIPISPRAKGHNAGDFEGLFSFVSSKGNKILALSTGKGEFEPMFVLKKSVTQKAEPWFPEGNELDNLIDEATNDFYGR